MNLHGATMFTLLMPSSEMYFHTSFREVKEAFLCATGSVLLSLAITTYNGSMLEMVSNV